MSTLKSSAEHLTLNADGSGNDIKFQSNATEVAAIDQAGNLTLSGTVDGVDIQTLNTAVAANTAKTGITSGQATAITAALPKAGGTMTGNINHADGIAANYGASNDLEIFHDGSNSYIRDVGTGSLIIKSSSPRMQDSGGKLLLVGDTDAGVALYYNAAGKLSTTATGVTVTGALTTGSMNWSSVTMGSSNSQSITGGVDTTITWGTERYDRLNEMDTSGRFTASVAGTYLVSLGLMSSQVSWAAGTVWYTVLYLNGAVRAYSDYSNYSPVATYYRQALLTQTVEMTAGQYLEVSVVHTRGAACTIHPDANHSHLSIQRVA